MNLLPMKLQNIVYYPRLFWASATSGALLIIYALFRMQRTFKESMQNQHQPFVSDQMSTQLVPIDGIITYTLFFTGVLILIGLAIADRKQVKENYRLMIRP